MKICVKIKIDNFVMIKTSAKTYKKIRQRYPFRKAVGGMKVKISASKRILGILQRKTEK